MKKVSMKIEGMSCSACANRIERIVNKLDGVEKGAVNFAAETLALEYDESAIELGQVEAAIEKAGFKDFQAFIQDENEWICVTARKV